MQRIIKPKQLIRQFNQSKILFNNNQQNDTTIMEDTKKIFKKMQSKTFNGLKFIKKNIWDDFTKEIRSSFSDGKYGDVYWTIAIFHFYIMSLVVLYVSLRSMWDESTLAGIGILFGGFFVNLIASCVWPMAILICIVDGLKLVVGKKN